MDVTNTTSLDQIHNLFIDKIKPEKGILWKLGVYSKIVKNYNSENSFHLYLNKMILLFQEEHY